MCVINAPSGMGNAVGCADAATTMDVGGMATQEQLPRAMQDDSMDVIGRVVLGTKTKQLPGSET